jgi:hypothetical protein
MHKHAKISDKIERKKIRNNGEFSLTNNKITKKMNDGDVDTRPEIRTGRSVAARAAIRCV